jgi:hypothetical protein
MVAVLGKMNRKMVAVLTGYPDESFSDYQESDETDEGPEKRKRRREGRGKHKRRIDRARGGAISTE